MVSSVRHPVVIIENTLAGGVLPPGNIIANGKNAITGFPGKYRTDRRGGQFVTYIRTFLSIVANMDPRGRRGIIKTTATLEQALEMAREICADA